MPPAQLSGIVLLADKEALIQTRGIYYIHYSILASVPPFEGSAGKTMGGSPMGMGSIRPRSEIDVVLGLRKGGVAGAPIPVPASHQRIEALDDNDPPSPNGQDTLIVRQVSGFIIMNLDPNDRVSLLWTASHSPCQIMNSRSEGTNSILSLLQIA